MTGWTPPALPAQWTWTAQLPPWVGRRAELARLEGIWAAVEHGARQLVFVAGEAGAGKSRLVMEAAWALHTRGVPVLVGACASDFGLPFAPLVAPVRALLAGIDRGELALADTEGASAAEARRLLSVLTSGVSSESTAETVAAVALGAVVSALTSACAHGPVAMVLEDLHWAGESGLRALRYIVERSANLPVLILATHSDTPPDASALVSIVTAELMRFPGVNRLDVSGLDTDDVSSYLTALHAGDAATVRSGAAMLRDTTGGNAFLLGEVWRELQRHGGLGHLANGEVTVPGSLPRRWGRSARRSGVRS